MYTTAWNKEHGPERHISTCCLRARANELNLSYQQMEVECHVETLLP